MTTVVILYIVLDVDDDFYSPTFPTERIATESCRAAEASMVMRNFVM